ncbi:MAG TPA: aldehyde dehydrogenase (NADP(+)) [Verrucomicrobiae bacterium]|nr:aldehyde dehydrogenase (NADP(+)) [Verrucomicrobiae bacterium]
MKLEGLSLLGRGCVKPAGKPTPAINPVTGAALQPGYFWATSADVEQAAQLAARAFAEYGRWPAKRRAALLRRIADLFEANATAIQERATQETALPPARLQGETARTCGQLRLFASLIEEGWWCDARIDHADPNRKPTPKPDVRSLLAPLGPVVVFSSSNFPFAFSVAGGDTASALAAGCPVIVKPHQGHLGTSELVGLVVQQAARDGDAPEGIFSLLFGPGRDLGMALVRHPLVRAVGFTGSRAGGRALMDAAAARPEPIPVYAEMGSINPVFLLPGALQQNAEAIASGLQASVTLGVGQFCTNPGLVFIENSPAAQTFLQKLEAAMAATPPGTMLTADLCASYRSGVEKFSKAHGVQRVVGVNADAGKGNAQAGAVLFVTNAETFLANHSLMDEVFGPSTLVVQCSSRSQMLEAARQLEGQLTATIHGTPEEFAARRDLLAVLETKAGRLVCNGFPTGVEVCHAMTHGGPYPATADGRSTSVGTRAIERFVRPVCYQNFPDAALPDELKDSNPLNLWRQVDGKLGKR